MPTTCRSKIKFEQISLKELQERIQFQQTQPEPRRPLRATEKCEPYSVHPKAIQKTPYSL